MIYITGDIHGSPERLSINSFPVQRELGCDDYVIICGDLGLIWLSEEVKDKNEKILD